MSANGGWSIRLVADCFDTLAFPGKGKVLARDYKKDGRFPVVDQGQERIAGWTDDEAALIDTPLPVVVFGDHTRVFKFIDTPFARGADGTQILKPHDDIDPLFFFFACRSINVPSRGYNRHFSLLREQQISVPDDKAEQEAIGRVLRLLEAHAEQQHTLESTARRLKSAAMRELFTRGLRGEPQKETEIGPVPESWRVEALGGYINPPDYGVTASASSECVGPRFLRITDTQERRVNWSIVPYCRCDEDTIEKKRLGPQDIVVARIGATTGKAFLIGECPEAVFASYLIRLRARQERLLAGFLYHFMQTDAYWRHIDQHKGGRLKSGVNVPILSALRIPLPQVCEQREVVAILDAIDRKIDFHRRKRALLEELFKSLLHKLMTGEIRVTDLDLSALPEPAVPAGA